MRLIKFCTPALGTVLVVSLTATLPVLASAQPSYSRVRVENFANGTSTYPCDKIVYGSSSSAICAAAVDGGVGTASTIQDATARIMSANATYGQTGVGVGGTTAAISSQYGQINILGTSGWGDYLRFHFLTTGPYATAAAGVQGFSDGHVGISGQGGGVAWAEVNANANGHTASYGVRSSSGPGYLDLSVPINGYLYYTFTGLWSYYWDASGDTYARDEPPGLTLSAGFAGTLDAIIAYDANGGTYGRVNFETGVLDLNVTPTPEPASLALLATGLVGLVPIVRRRFWK